MNSSKTLKMLVVALAASAGAAHATWTFPQDTTPGPIADSVSGGVVLSSATGFSALNGGTALNNGLAGATLGESNLTTQLANGSGAVGFASGATWAQTALSSFPALGMNSDGSSAPNHAFDNGPKTVSGVIQTFANGGLGKTEGVFLQFASSVTLQSLKLSYVRYDADISVWRYTGGSTSATAFDGSSASTMSGWSLLGNYANMTETTNSLSNNTLGSSWWFISAYNSAWGGDLTQGNDFFKLAAVSGVACTSTAVGNTCNNTSRVPEPGSLALVGAALLGITASRRRFIGRG